jgi:hypothetical protein
MREVAGTTAIAAAVPRAALRMVAMRPPPLPRPENPCS